MDPSPAELSPIFIHSSFRTSSTWLWSKFRNQPDAWAYCEIFHEAIAGITIENARQLNYRSWDSNHPPTAPYFFEFFPLIQPEGGITGYNSSMAFERWFIPENGLSGTLSPAEHTYIDILIDNARSLGRRPVLADTRTLGRLQAVKSAYPSCLSILLVRNLFHQWSSYSSQALAGNPYFIASLDKAVRAAGHDEFSRSLDHWYAGRIVAGDDEAMFKTFLIHHLYLYAHAFDAADSVVEVNAIASDNQQRLQKEEELHKLTGLQIDLADAKLELKMADIKIDSMPEFIDEIEQWMKRIAASGTSPSGFQFATRMKNEALSELDKFLFYSKDTKKYYGSRALSLTKERDDALRKLENLQSSTTAADQRISELESVLAESQQEVTNLATRLRQSEEEFSILIRSSSWRLTRPFRSLQRLIGKKPI